MHGTYRISPGGMEELVTRLECKDFDVADPVFNTLLSMDFDERTAALEKAKGLAPAGGRPVINSLS